MKTWLPGFQPIGRRPVNKSQETTPAAIRLQFCHLKRNFQLSSVGRHKDLPDSMLHSPE